MSNSVYAAIARQSGLLSEMQVVANNIANLSTTGFRREGLVFTEHVTALEGKDGSLSMAIAQGRATFDNEGAFRQTGGAFDLAIEGDGYFLVETPAGQRLTRAGAFSPGSDGILATQDGYSVLGADSAPVFIPTDLGTVSISGDGTISADGDPIGQIGLFGPTDPLGLRREGGVLFVSEAGIDAVPDGRMLQGFVEGANVDPVAEIARMIEIQRAYELGQTFLEQEDNRIVSVISTIGGS